MKQTRTKRLQGFLVVSALFVLPMAVRAQIDAGSGAPMQQNQQQSQQQQQQQPGVHRPDAETRQDSNPSPGMTGQEMKDKMFLRKAAAGGIAEVKLGQLAADKGSSEEVKSFGAKMVADHTTLNNEMKPIADAMGVRLPRDMDKADQAEYEKLSSLSGADFDQEYITDMVKDHRKDLREFHMESMATNDEALKAAVDKGEGVIRGHARMIMKIARDKGIAIPQGGKADGGGPPSAAQPPPQ